MFPFHQAYGKKKWKILELPIFVAKNTPKLSTIVGENFRITYRVIPYQIIQGMSPMVSEFADFYICCCC